MSPNLGLFSTRFRRRRFQPVHIAFLRLVATYHGVIFLMFLEPSQLVPIDLFLHFSSHVQILTFVFIVLFSPFRLSKSFVWPLFFHSTSKRGGDFAPFALLQLEVDCATAVCALRASSRAQMIPLGQRF